MSVPPNPRLQRTPSAAPPSPLSRKPLGVGSSGQQLRRGICGVIEAPAPLAFWRLAENRAG